jgi:hypothetical protein
MKKILSTIVFFSLFLFASKLYAQCSLSKLHITVNKLTNNGTNNLLNIDLSFYMQENNGNKQVYINLWNESDYSNGAGEFNWMASSAKMPTYSQIDGASGGKGPLAVIGIINDNVKDFVSNYTGDNANINYANGRLVKGTSMTAQKITTVGDPNYDKTYFNIKGVDLKLPNTPTVSLKGNVWGSQTNIGSIGANPTIHCYDNEFDFTIGGVTVNANSSLNCAVVPRTFQLSLDVSAITNIDYQVYVDADNNGELSENSSGTITDYLGYSTPSAIEVEPVTGTDYLSGDVAIPAPYGTDPQYKSTQHFLVLSYTNAVSTVTISQDLINYCSVLPVHFKSFSAYRNPQRKEQVMLKWETASEQNNRGFNVQRKVGGQWKNIAFVFSQTDNGNSNAALAYEYKEINTANTVSQYQIQQVDFDGKTSYSDVKSVVGINQVAAVQVYPNPAVNGKVNLLFKEINNPKEVIVNDINGRVVKQFREVRDNTLTIEGLQSGFYTIKVTDRLASTTTVEKVIIKK